MHIRTETARFYVKRVLNKTGTCKQSARMRLMLSLPGDAPQADKVGPFGTALQSKAAW